MKFKTKKRGDTWNGLEISVSGDNLDLNNCKAVIEFKYLKRNGVSMFKYSTDDNTLIRNNNIFKMEPRVLNYEAGEYYFDFQLTLSNGVVKTLFEGNLILKQDVSD